MISALGRAFLRLVLLLTELLVSFLELFDLLGRQKFDEDRLSRGLGVQLFGGTVYDGNPALEGTDYMEEGYDILNNNDYAMAFMSLFTFITAGPYHEFIEAAEAAIPVVGYLYHVSFYVRGQC